MTEAEPECFAQAGVWVDTDEALVKSGDLLNAIKAGTWAKDQLRGDLTQLCRKTVAARLGTRQRTVFKAVGSALEDLAAAKLAYRSFQRAAVAV
jgi:ornithine cyclodeaminase